MPGAAARKAAPGGKGLKSMAQALHAQAAEYIQSRILSGEYPVGSQIPTENELAALLGISRPTVRQALESLANEGFLTRVKGRGTFVTRPKVVHESTAFITGYRAESRKHGRTLRTKVLALWEEVAPEHVAEALGLRPGDAVTCLIRLRHLEGYNQNAPVVYTIVYVPCALFPDMCSVDFTDASLYEILAEKGLEVRHASRKLEVVPTPPDIAASLRISPFEPAVFITSCGRTASMTPVEYAESYYPAGSSSFLIEIHR